jgi:hypothetical protein
MAVGSLRTCGARAVAMATVALVAIAASAGAGEPRRNWFDTPFDQALAGQAACPRPEGPLLTEAQMRSLAHARIERGTSCWLAKKCEDSNAYRRDPDVQQQVVAALRREAAFARSSVWVTTERRWVTLQGCADSARAKARMLDVVRRLDGVEEVFDQLIVGTRAAPRWTVDPAWRSEAQAKKMPTR